jgi:uncharacterized protein YrrD
MIRATELAGRAVVDIDAAEKLGTIDKIILDSARRRHCRRLGQESR